MCHLLKCNCITYMMGKNINCMMGNINCMGSNINCMMGNINENDG